MLASRYEPFHSDLSRREALRLGLGMFGLSLPGLFQCRGLANSSVRGAGKAKSCIVLFSWGGMSHLETWDPKPEAPREVRGDYRSIPTATPGVRFGEFMTQLATQTERMTVVRSVHHQASDHRKAAYWNLTGHAPAAPEELAPVLPSRADWPCLGSLVARVKKAPAGLPGTVTLPYPIADRGLNNGQDGGFLGMTNDPLIVKPAAGKPYAGVSPNMGTTDLRLPADVDAQRQASREALAGQLGSARVTGTASTRGFDHYRQMASDLLLTPRVRDAFDLDRESPKLRERYGDHICGQSVLMARRLTEAGVPLTTVFCGAGDLNGSAGANWDTHGDNFNRLKKDLLPPLERASVALLDDLAARGTLEETLVVWLTEFGRTPKLNGGAGRDHYPNCYSVAFAGGGVRGGQVYGRSDRQGTEPSDQGCGPKDLHATVFHALGIGPDTLIEDNLGRPHFLCEGRPLPIF